MQRSSSQPSIHSRQQQRRGTFWACDGGRAGGRMHGAPARTVSGGVVSRRLVCKISAAVTRNRKKKKGSGEDLSFVLTSTENPPSLAVVE